MSWRATLVVLLAAVLLAAIAIAVVRARPTVGPAPVGVTLLAT